MPRWRTLLSPPLDGATNMALDELLRQRAAATGEAVLRVYGWSEPTLSLGRNQRAAGVYDVGAVRAAGLPVVRRPTGGRAILHHREITYSVTAPHAPAESLRHWYGRINVLLLHALRALGVAAEVAAPATRAPLPGPAPCFDEPGAGELVAGGRKLVGSAQWRDEGAFLQHGSILVDDDQSRLAELVGDHAAPHAPPATLRALLGRAPGAEAVLAALADAVRATEDPSVCPLGPDELPAPERVARERARFLDPRWTWRR